MTSTRSYHHGNLRQALLEAATAEITEVGASTMSLRKVAARVGVTHTAAGHHFGDKTGLLTALAARGYRELAATLEQTSRTGGDLLELGLAYLRFAHHHRPWFEVMFRPEILQTDDPELVDARAASAGQLRGATDALDSASGNVVALGAWSFVHGFTTLWLAGNLTADALRQAEALFRQAAVAFTSLNAPARSGE